MVSEGKQTGASIVTGLIFNDFLLIWCLLNLMAQGWSCISITRVFGPHTLSSECWLLFSSCQCSLLSKCSGVLACTGPSRTQTDGPPHRGQHVVQDKAVSHNIQLKSKKDLPSLTTEKSWSGSGMAGSRCPHLSPSPSCFSCLLHVS